MRQTLFPIHLLRKRPFRRTIGFVGVEIGCHRINFAQVQRVNDCWQLSAIWSLEHSPREHSENNPIRGKIDETFGWLSHDEMLKSGLSHSLEMEKLNALFVGNRCAATLTDGMIAYRELDLPSKEPSEANAMVRSEIAIETDLDVEELMAECWELPQSNPRMNTFSFGAVSIKKSEAFHVASCLLRAGFECQTMDALPCAMARSTAMMVPDSDVSTLALDLGYQQTTVTLVKAGRPILSRELRGLGLITLIDQIAASFELSRSDAQTLLFQPADSVIGSDSSSLHFSNPIHQHLSSFLQLLTAEIGKTIQFANSAYRTAVPGQILLMGAGSRIASLNSSLSDRTGLPTHYWRINQSDNLFDDHHTSVYAVAAGLSTLAWE